MRKGNTNYIPQLSSQQIAIYMNPSRSVNYPDCTGISQLIIRNTTLELIVPLFKFIMR